MDSKRDVEIGEVIMWKESYRIGVDLIDKQHMELFHMVEKLVKSLQAKGDWNDKKEDCRQAVEFMKQYVVMHFKTEEAYQESIKYSGIEGHKELHRKFTGDVLEYEKQLVESDFENKIVKQFTGMLTAWLIYHVADADQKFGTHTLEKVSREKEKTLMLCFVKSVAHILQSMGNIDSKELNGKAMDTEQQFGDISITVGVIGEIEGSIRYEFSEKFAFTMMKVMTMMDFAEIDEMVCSAMAEISNIISGNATTALADKGFSCDIMPPIVSAGEVQEQESLKSRVLIDSPLGEIALGTTFLA